MNKEQLDRILGVGSVYVVFRKKDGSERQMICTTSLDKIPSEKHPKGTATKANPDIRKVFDVEIQEWRSFRYDSVIQVNAI